MTDQDTTNSFEDAADDDATIVTTAVEAETDQIGVTDQDDEDDDQANEVEEEDFFPEDANTVLPDPASIITVQTSSGGKQYVQTTEPIAVSEVLARAGIQFTVGSEFWLNGAQIQMNTPVPPAQTLMVVSTVKGGAI
jgi:hypothetical protein